jgi:hypothetical protein
MSREESPELHPVMWVWWENRSASRWMLAVQNAENEAYPWSVYEIDGGHHDKVTGRDLALDYFHHTPIYAPRSTPE